MSIQPQNAERLVRLLVWIAGVAATALGAWVTSKVRIYHDNRKAHLEDLKQRVLAPFSDATGESFQRLVSHESPVVAENWSARGIRTDARVTEDEADEGSGLTGLNPWPNVFSVIDEALYEDAKRNHFSELIKDAVKLANSWAAHVERCRTWVDQMAIEVLARSGMHAYGPPFTTPYVLHYRLGVFAYRRLFRIRTGALYKTNQGQMWALEGAPGLPRMVGCSAIGPEQQLDALAVELDKIIVKHSKNAEQLREESQNLGRDVAALHSAFQLAIANKRLRKRCDLVPFF